MSAGAKVRAAADFADFVAGMVCDGHDGEQLVKTIEARDAEVRAAALEEARLVACEFKQPCDGETLEPGRLRGWCSYCTEIRALAAQAKAPAQAKGGG